MSRVIKFRCWNMSSKKMHDWDEMVVLNKINLLAKQQPSYPVMQFTGLKDCNSVDIYEGDIVHIDYVEYCPSPFNVDSFTGVVKFIDGSFMAEKDGSLGDFLFQEIALVKVIGNVHQNPELLEASK